MRTPMALEAAADCRLVKLVSQKLKEKRCGDCREGKLGPQGNWSQYLSAASKTGIANFDTAKFRAGSSGVWNDEAGRG